MQVIERIAGRYEVEEVGFGRVYKWCPECVVVECECGERPTLSGSETVCGCGLDLGPATQRGLEAGRLGDEALHPWRYCGGREDTGIPV